MRRGRLDFRSRRRSLRARRGGVVAFLAVILSIVMVPCLARSDDAPGELPSKSGQPSPTQPKGSATPTAAGVASANNSEILPKLSTWAKQGNPGDELQAISGNPGEVN